MSPCPSLEVEIKLSNFPAEFLHELRAVFILSGTKKQLRSYSNSTAFCGHYWNRCVFLHAYPFARRIVMTFSRRTALVLSAGAGLIMVVVLLWALGSNERHRLEALTADCPISWVAYSCGTNHATYFRRGRPVRNPVIGWAVWRVHKAISALSGTDDYSVRRYGAQGQTQLIVHVGLKASMKSHPRAVRVVFRDQKGQCTEAQSGLRTDAWWIYQFDGMTQGVHGGVIEFFSAFAVEPVARLKL